MAGAKPQAATLVPFFAQYDRRTAVYFPTFTAERWATEEAAFVAAQRDAAALAKRTVDVIQLGEQQPEQDHAFASNQSDLLSWDGRAGQIGRAPSELQSLMRISYAVFCL